MKTSVTLLKSATIGISVFVVSYQMGCGNIDLASQNSSSVQNDSSIAITDGNSDFATTNAVLRRKVIGPGGSGDPGDVIPPTVSISSPTDQSWVFGTVTLSANATDNSSVLGVQFKLDGINLGSEIQAVPYTMNWDTTPVMTGNHQLSATARDPSGNVSTVTITVYVDNEPQP